MDIRKTRCNFLLSEDIYTEFRRHAAKEKTTIPQIVSQFMKNYAVHLDSSFLRDAKAVSGTKKIHFAMSLDADIYKMFKKKTKKEGIAMNAPVEQFIRNYVHFINGR